MEECPYFGSGMVRHKRAMKELDNFSYVQTSFCFAVGVVMLVVAMLVFCRSELQDAWSLVLGVSGGGSLLSLFGSVLVKVNYGVVQWSVRQPYRGKPAVNCTYSDYASATRYDTINSFKARKTREASRLHCCPAIVFVLMCIA